MKTNDKGTDLRKWSAKKLKDTYLGLYDVIYTANCYGTKDLINFQNIEDELLRRGYTINEDITITKD